MFDRFVIREALHRAVSGEQRVLDGFVRHERRRRIEVVSDLGVAKFSVSVVDLLEHEPDLLVQLGSTQRIDGVVQHVTNEGVHETVAPRRSGRFHHQARGDRFTEQSEQVSRRPLWSHATAH